MRRIAQTRPFVPQTPRSGVEWIEAEAEEPASTSSSRHSAAATSRVRTLSPRISLLRLEPADDPTANGRDVLAGSTARGPAPHGQARDPSFLTFQMCSEGNARAHSFDA